GAGGGPCGDRASALYGEPPARAGGRAAWAGRRELDVAGAGRAVAAAIGRRAALGASRWAVAGVHFAAVGRHGFALWTRARTPGYAPRPGPGAKGAVGLGGLGLRPGAIQTGAGGGAGGALAPVASGSRIVCAQPAQSDERRSRIPDRKP